MVHIILAEFKDMGVCFRNLSKSIFLYLAMEITGIVVKIRRHKKLFFKILDKQTLFPSLGLWWRGHWLIHFFMHTFYKHALKKALAPCFQTTCSLEQEEDVYRKPIIVYKNST
jgi:hypothetical protein